MTLEQDAEDARHKINNFFDKNATTGSSSSGSMPEKEGVTGAITTVTGTVGAAVGGVSRTVGGVVGAAGRGLGGTINNTTGTKPVGDALQSLTNSIEDATTNVAHGVEQGSQGKKVW